MMILVKEDQSSVHTFRESLGKWLLAGESWRNGEIKALKEGEMITLATHGK